MGTIRKNTKVDEKSPKKEEKKKTNANIENGGVDINKHDKHKSSSLKDHHSSGKSKHRDKHRSSPHKKHASVLLSPTHNKKEAELTFKLSNTPNKDTAQISSFSSTKDNCPVSVNDSSTEAIKKMISGEKPLQNDKHK